MGAAGHETPGPAPRILVDLAALERMPLASRTRPPRPHSFRSEDPPHFAETSPSRVPTLGETERVALATIGRLARDGQLVLCSHDQFEPAGPTGHWRGTWREPLGEVPLTIIKSALARDALGEDVFRDGPQSGALVRLCTRLKQTETVASATKPAVAPAGADGMRSLQRFHQLATRVQGDRLADLFHLWSAECAACPWWLTLDPGLSVFLRVWVEPGLGQQPLRVQPVLPNALLTRLGIVARDAPADADSRVVALRSRAPSD